MILEPISIATGGYVGIGPTSGPFCPLPLAIGSDGYIRFELPDEEIGDGGHWKGHGAVISEPMEPSRPIQKLALLAVAAIQQWYE